MLEFVIAEFPNKLYGIGYDGTSIYTDSEMSWGDTAALAEYILRGYKYEYQRIGRDLHVWTITGEHTPNNRRLDEMEYVFGYNQDTIHVVYRDSVVHCSLREIHELLENIEYTYHILSNGVHILENFRPYVPHPTYWMAESNR